MWFIEVFLLQIYIFNFIPGGNWDASKQDTHVQFSLYVRLTCELYFSIWSSSTFNFSFSKSIFKYFYYEILKARYPEHLNLFEIFKISFPRDFHTESYLDQDDLFKNHHKNWMAEHKMKSKALVWHFDETSELGEKKPAFFG